MRVVSLYIYICIVNICIYIYIYIYINMYAEQVERYSRIGTDARRTTRTGLVGIARSRLSAVVWIVLLMLLFLPLFACYLSVCGELAINSRVQIRALQLAIARRQTDRHTTNPRAPYETVKNNDDNGWMDRWMGVREAAAVPFWLVHHQLPAQAHETDGDGATHTPLVDTLLDCWTLEAERPSCAVRNNHMLLANPKWWSPRTAFHGTVGRSVGVEWSPLWATSIHLSVCMCVRLYVCLPLRNR